MQLLVGANEMENHETWPTIDGVTVHNWYDGMIPRCDPLQPRRVGVAQCVYFFGGDLTFDSRDDDFLRRGLNLDGLVEMCINCIYDHAVAA